ncbi:anchored repeat-type ABC transporter ATP-binding subunit [Phytohabitans aurantiacus]|uniref:Anchored repeat-type ABC transporter ATP-binding subunit n=1 Tax=Phytohabitans aurantiacus TaxID=3016789 RepID=A0ABQ5QMQ9_9ACTN|nr:anchored repeat-type ABC transporter ATP-binding subunit [Phytohabitans aurantiacus]GLH95833.1 anchored repeat-type ABC transporter ATP-binding subunit [Phytohabitans aurantiacus]
MTVLDVSGVAVRLAGRQVLTDVTLKVAAGELVGLIGPNGAGKTTLLRAVLGLLPLAAGQIRLVGRTPAQVRGTVGYVPQRHEFAWDFPIDVEKAVLAGLARRIGWMRSPGRADRIAVAEALERVGMAQLRRRPIGELSGGQRQRVLVARALALRPELMLLDEPFTGLDNPTQSLLTDLLRQLGEEGKAIVITTHDLPAAAAVCGRLCLLNGVVVADAPPAELTDPDVWLRAFGVGGSDALSRTLGKADAA